MKITLLKTNLKPTDIAVASARSCYFGKHIVTPQVTVNWQRKNDLLNSIFKAGHHTTLMHYNFTFLIEGMSRLLIWRLLHAHPFYNSEQVSQRYVKMKINNFTYPKEADKEIWQQYYEKMFGYYEQLIERLTPEIEKVLPKNKVGEAPKRAQEFARYLLPLGMNAHLYHTINVITALRYINAAKVLPEARKEALEFVKEIKKQMIELDPDLEPLIEFAEKEGVVFPEIDIQGLKQKYGVGQQDKVKVFDIVDSSFTANANYAGVLRMSNMFLDESILGSFNSYIKLSMSADAQNQRHRRSPAVRPSLESIYQRDFYIPPIIEKTCKDIYVKAVEYSYDFFEQQKEKLGFGEAAYALLNAHNIEIFEHNDFQEFQHKAQMRLCYNAQQEIFDIVYEQVKQLRSNKESFYFDGEKQTVESNPVQAAQYFVPPCMIRKEQGIKPVCPEGDRYCGHKVWTKKFEELHREI